MGSSLRHDIGSRETLTSKNIITFHISTSREVKGSRIPGHPQDMTSILANGAV